ncbi:GGDEF domain-containing protein [Demequina salsinemoris]|uniref:GGDEF domain-containing protein n=1 Tax=Demequina salsinemoris TaxID=577470 RepID=UPI0007855632|nr:GGDEF domain-containing protein [Demequina salsinemoris]
MVDPLTARIVLALVALVALVLFYVGTYRATRARYALWWCLALVSTGISTAAYSFNGSTLQVVLNPLANMLAVGSTAFVWFAVRAIRGRRPAWAALAGLIAVVLCATVLGHPAEDEWAGAGVLIAAMLACLVLAAHEVRMLLRERPRSDPADPHDSSRTALLALYASSVLFGAWYGARLVGFVVLGTDDARLEEWFGTFMTSVVLVVVLLIATYGMSELSHYELTRELRFRASYDYLTGLLSRGEFLARAEQRRAWPQGPKVLVEADLDHFKTLNDALGHAAGDRALLAFGSVCRQAVEGIGIAGRIGGEEFAILLDSGNLEDARVVAARISERYGAEAPVRLGKATVSYGATVVTRGESLEAAMLRADDALYKAKHAGRDRFEFVPRPAL